MTILWHIFDSFWISDSSFHDFVNHPCMSEIKERSIFIHIDVPGHEDNAPNLPDRYVYVCVCVCVYKTYGLVLYLEYHLQEGNCLQWLRK